MISDVDIEDWDKESQEAYLKWAEDYGLEYEPWIGQPDVAAAFKAGMLYMQSHYIVVHKMTQKEFESDKFA